MTVHVRKTNQGGRDRRLALRHNIAGSNTLKPTLCGEAPTGEDLGRSTAKHFVKNWRPILSHPADVLDRLRVPQHVRDLDSKLCSGCVAKLNKPGSAASE